MIQIVVPMAGEGRRFAEAGYTVPKPFVDVAGVPMIEKVLENLYIEDCKFILIARSDHVQMQRAVMERIQLRYDVQVLETDQLTEGAACTVLLATRLINSQWPVLVANSDALIDIRLGDFVRDSDERDWDGSILTFPADHPKWSYAALASSGLVERVAEKQVISPHATAGYYYFRRGVDFVNSAIEMIAHNERVNNEFYVAPAYNYAIAAGAKIGIYGITEAQMHGLGTPKDLGDYLSLIDVKKELAR